LVGRVSLFVAVVVVFNGCGSNEIQQGARRRLLRGTSVPRSVPDDGKFRPAPPKSPDGSPGRGILK